MPYVYVLYYDPCRALKRQSADYDDYEGIAGQEDELTLVRRPLLFSPATRKLRTDTEERREHNNTIEFSVVMVTLNQFCKGKGKALPWEEVLKDMNKMITEA